MTVLRAPLERLVFAVLMSCSMMAIGSARAQIVEPASGFIYTVFRDTGGDHSREIGRTAETDRPFPGGVTTDTGGNIYIAESSNHRILRMEASTGTISALAGTGTEGYSGDGGPANEAELSYPTDAAIDADGDIYIADAGNNRIRKVAASTGIITTVAGNGDVGYNGDMQVATEAELSHPVRVAVGPGGDIYIADAGNNRIRKVAASTGMITTVAGNGSAGYNGDAQPAIAAEIESPAGLALDGEGNLYVADEGNNRIREIAASTGMIATVAGNGSAGNSGDGGLATSAKLDHPSGVTVDASGIVYMADEGNCRIRKVTGTTIEAIAGSGVCGDSGDGGPATEAQLSHPEDVQVGISGNIYIADTGGGRIRVVGGALTTSTFKPLYRVVSILYPPPGDGSSERFSNSDATGATSTVGGSFTIGNAFRFSSGIPVLLSNGGSIEHSTAPSNSYAFTETFTSATALKTGAYPNTSNAVDHNLDVFEIWLNPVVKVESSGAIPVSYTLASDTLTANGTEVSLGDIVGIPAIVMEAAPSGVTTLNPTGAAGVTTVPVTFLVPRAIAQSRGVNGYLPGLGAICANNTLYQLQLAEDLAEPNSPAAICTQANQCGCTPADFAGILLTDPLLNYNSDTYSASPYPGDASPLLADSLPTSSGPGSDASICGLNAIPASASCRYVPVPSPGTNTSENASRNAVPMALQLSGERQTDIAVTDATTTPRTIEGSVSNNVAGTFVSGPLFNSLKSQNAWTWTDEEIVGNPNGAPNSKAVTLKTSTPGCKENVKVYEDTVFHTFVFQVLKPNSACAVGQTITFPALPSPVAYGTSPLTLSATASSGLPVSFRLVSGPGAVSGNTLAFNGTGTVTIAANQMGNAYYAVAPQQSQRVVVSAGSPTFEVTVIPNNPSLTSLSLGHSRSYTVTVSALSGFTGSVVLGLSGLPAGVSYNFSPPSITTSGIAILTLTAAYDRSTYIGYSTLTVTGTRRNMTKSTSLMLATRPLQYRLTACPAP